MMTKIALATSIDPFALSSDGRALLLINGGTFGAVTHEEFLDWCDEQVEETVAASLDFRFRAATVEPSFGGDLWCAVGDLTYQVSRMADDFDQLSAIYTVMLSRIMDPTHLTVAEVARIKGVCTKTVRNWISEGKLTREVVPGTRQSGIPIREVFSGWIDAERAAEITKKWAEKNG